MNGGTSKSVCPYQLPVSLIYVLASPVAALAPELVTSGLVSLPETIPKCLIDGLPLD
jgi:hypothetical protein